MIPASNSEVSKVLTELAQRLAAQKGRAVSLDEEKNVDACVYETEDGKHCLVGHLFDYMKQEKRLPEDLDLKALPNEGVVSVFQTHMHLGLATQKLLHPYNETQVSVFLQKAQRYHDDYSSQPVEQLYMGRLQLQQELGLTDEQLTKLIQLDLEQLWDFAGRVCA